jgi:hypothetical protein
METFVNDTVQFTIDTNIDVSGYTSLMLRYKKPSGITGCWHGVIDPLDNSCITYTCAIGDLDEAGEWLIQATVTSAGVRLTGRWNSFIVHDPLRMFCTTLPPTTMVPTT